ncbi:MAG: DUF2220 family protein [Bifidobacteriaceae bacterium]|nr:DUF2220 family protein [Bifidobacteriaceae bacterium]
MVKLADLAEADFTRLQAVIEWLVNHPDSGLYARQVPVREIDSKWLERHGGVVRSLVQGLSGRDKLGLTLKPSALLRGRLLDGALANGGPLDFAAPVPQWDALKPVPRVALILENLQSLLALPAWPGSGLVALHGGGYAVDLLGGIVWLKTVPLYYWGDLDGHGFAILNRLRSHLPGVVSLMMDQPTLSDHADLAVPDPNPVTAKLPHLTDAEQAAYLELQSSGRRLEQERVPWDEALRHLARAGLRTGVRRSRAEH